MLLPCFPVFCTQPTSAKIFNTVCAKGRRICAAFAKSAEVNGSVKS